MPKAQPSGEKLREVQKMAREFDESLQPDFDRIGFHHGGNLLLGRFYGESDRIYFGLNPGLARGDGDPFCTCLQSDDGFNRPFRNPEDFNKNFQFGREFQRFLTAHPDLDKWFNNKVTSAFLCPWRTKNRDALYRLNNHLAGKLFEFSSQLVWEMIEHHDAKVIVVVALNGVHLFNELFRCKNGASAWDYREVNAKGKVPGFAKYVVPGMGITVLQIPRFSPARRKILDSFADWLRMELRPYSNRGTPS